MNRNTAAHKVWRRVEKSVEDIVSPEENGVDMWSLELGFYAGVSAALKFPGEVTFDDAQAAFVEVLEWGIQ